MFPAPLTRDADSIECRFPRPITIGVRQKDGFQVRLNELFNDHLSHAIRHSGHTQNPLPSRLLRNGDSAHRRWKVASRAHSIPELVEIIPQVGFELLDCLAIHTGRTRIGFDRFVRFVHQPLVDLERLVRRTHRHPPVASCFDSYDHLTRSLCSSPISVLPRSYGSVRPSALPRYSRLAVFPACASPLTSKRLVPAVPRKSLHPIHALSTPVVVCPIIRLPTDLSQRWKPPLVLTTLMDLTTRLRRFTFVRLSDAHLLKVFLELFLQRSP